MSDSLKTKTVGTRRAPTTPQEFHDRAWRMEREVDALHPWPKPRGFVFKAKTWEEYARWRAEQTNPRLW